MARAHYRTEQIGLRLVHHIAPAVTAALDHLARERAIADGWPTRDGSGTGRRLDGDSATEAAALLSQHLADQIDDINDAVHNVEIGVDLLRKLAVEALGVRVPAAADQLRCKDGQHGRDAALWSNDVGCAELPTKLGLCSKHYMQLYRYKVAHGLKVAQDFEPSV